MTKTVFDETVLILESNQKSHRICEAIGRVVERVVGGQRCSRTMGGPGCSSHQPAPSIRVAMTVTLQVPKACSAISPGTASFRLHSTAPQLEWVLLRQTEGQRGQLRGGCSLPARFLEVAAFGVCQVQGPLAVPEPHQGVLCRQPCQGGLLASTWGTFPKACGLLSP